MLLGADIRPQWIYAGDVNENTVADVFKGIDGVILPGDLGERDLEGKVAAIKYIREQNIPFLDILDVDILRISVYHDDYGSVLYLFVVELSDVVERQIFGLLVPSLIRILGEAHLLKWMHITGWDISPVFSGHSCKSCRYAFRAKNARW